jgi:hypothetical protein
MKKRVEAILVSCVLVFAGNLIGLITADFTNQANNATLCGICGSIMVCCIAAGVACGWALDTDTL